MKSKMKVLTICVCAFITLSFLFSSIDYNRAISNKKPILSFLVASAKDGGTTIYIGFGYQLVLWHKLEVRDGEEHHGYLVGTELKYFPFFKYWPLLTHNFEPGISLQFRKE